jgi:uncharacterized phage protein (TIGR01671 family)
MREIKFRAWHNKTKQMVGSETVFRWLFEDPKNTKDIMQYTGLKDKSGIEIYEGDIIKFNHFWNGFYGTALVKWSESGFVDDRYNGDEVFYLNDLSDHKDCEVIGNIYENKELLK